MRESSPTALIDSSLANSMMMMMICIFVVLTAKSPTTSITITGLNPLSTYEFRVSAYNELGNSPFTDPLILTTEIEGNYHLLALLYRSHWITPKKLPIKRIHNGSNWRLIGTRAILGPN